MRRNSIAAFATAITASISDSILENAKRKGCALSINYAKNTTCCQNATSRSASCKKKRHSGSERTTHRHLRLALCGLAREILSERFAPTSRARIRRPHLQFGGDQRFVLFVAAAIKLQTLVRCHAGRFCFR